MNRILLIDDDEDMLAMTGRWLEKSGYEVVKASSGKEAFDLMGIQKPDLILLDYCMPDTDGPAVLKYIRTNEETAKIPVLYRTGMDDAVSDADGYSADGIVSKSEGKPALIKAVQSVLEQA